MSSVKDIKPILPTNGQIISEDIPTLQLSKPRLIPLKSFTLEKLEKIQREALKKTKELKESSS